MPVDLLQGDLHAVIVWYAAWLSGVSDCESRFVNSSACPRFKTGGRPFLPADERSPRPYVKSSMFTLFVGGPASSDVGFGRPNGVPPWLLFSARWPCVSSPFGSTPWVNGSFPSGRSPWANQVTMIPIVSYHDAFEMS